MTSSSGVYDTEEDGRGQNCWRIHTMNSCILSPSVTEHGRLMSEWVMQMLSDNNIIITKTMFMVLSSWQSHCESSPGSFDEYSMAPSSRRPKTKPDDLGCESACTGCQKLHPPSPFIIITQPESWYSFYRSTEGRRLSRPGWLVTYQDGLPVHRRSPILVLTASDVARLRWLRPTRYR